jgi:hypothetical protein
MTLEEATQVLGHVPPSGCLREYITNFAPYGSLDQSSLNAELESLSAEILPQAEVQETVKFLDGADEVQHSAAGQMDSIRMVGVDSTTPLGEFFSRPVTVYSQAWDLGATVNTSILPWTTLNTKRFGNKLSNYSLFQGNMHIKIVVNATPFHYGRMIASYTPMIGYDELTQKLNLFNPPSDIAVIPLSQRQNLYIDPCTCQGGEMVVPFMWWKNAFDTADKSGGDTDFTDAGQLQLKTINTLQHANGGTDGGHLMVYVWFSNVQIGVPTTYNIADLVPQASAESMPTSSGGGTEYKPTGILSRPAAALSTMMGKLSHIPTIGRYATATSIGADAVGRMANLFGFSRPVLLESSRYRPDTKGNMAVTNAPDDCVKLSLDLKQETSVDPAIFGLGSEDEMAIAYITQRESYYTQFAWNDNQVQEKLLWNCVVDPYLARTEDDILGVDTAVAMTSLGFVSSMFSYWRGTIKFRFQVVCSAYHRGRLKIVYDPNGTPTNNPPTEYAETSTAFSTIVDISESTDFEIECGWGRGSSYRRIGTFEDNFDTSAIGPNGPVFYEPTIDNYGNGTIAVYVVNDLTCPGDIVNVNVNVFVSAGEDFEVAGPTAEKIQGFRLNTYNTVDPPALLASQEPLEVDIPPPSNKLKAVRSKAKTVKRSPEYDGRRDANGVTRHVNAYGVRSMRLPTHMNPEADISNEATTNPNVPDNAPTVDSDGAKIPLSSPMNLVHFGESIRSLRQLCKRYAWHERLPIIPSGSPTAGSTELIKYQRGIMPFEPGFTNEGLGAVGTVTTSVSTPVGSRDYAYAFFTPLRYISLAYTGWRGGVRYLIDFSGVACGCEMSGVRASRYISCSPKFEQTIVPGGVVTGAMKKAVLIAQKETAGAEGMHMQALSVNPTLNFEIPFYSRFRFMPSRIYSWLGDPSNF